MDSEVFILGGAQTDFGFNWSKNGHDLYDIMGASMANAIEHIKLEPAQINVAHIGNFTGELFSGQGHLGGLLTTLYPDFYGLPTSRHEAACASGSIAILAAMADIKAGNYDVAAVTGVEQMRNVSGEEAATYLGAAAWMGKEAQSARYIWPSMFSNLTEEYHRRYGINRDHLAEISKLNFANAKNNPLAQTRKWKLTDQHFSCDDEVNPVIEGHVRRHDCSQITDGSATLILASERYASEYATKHAQSLSQIPRILGFGHRTAPMLYQSKVEASKNHDLIFPHVQETIKDAFHRAELPNVESIDVIETHDCFSITEYMAIDHFGLTAPGESWKAVEEGTIKRTGKTPINPGGGLIGIGHPVGATGVRMVLDGWKQVTDNAKDCQIDNAKTVATLNIGGSTTTVVSFIIGR
ncbi:MAG: acetyl-CoA acetyltransferase [Myxococcota bacterium]|nr:acetyl-CoA acetyltransferase [Myxococcota bacterium]